eukprot:808931-Alexandrium_andersonii.AAC.1
MVLTPRCFSMRPSLLSKASRSARVMSLTSLCFGTLTLFAFRAFFTSSGRMSMSNFEPEPEASDSFTSWTFICTEFEACGCEGCESPASCESQSPASELSAA